ncbi:MAG: efflux transporter outer membrane subunit [Rikenellaceae bacterium]
MKKIIYTLIILLSVNCSPLLQTPSVELPSDYSFGAGFSRDTTPIESSWWLMFGDTTLNRVITTALSNNRNLAAALANVESARSYVKVAKAEFLPSVSVGAEVEAYRINGVTTKEFRATPTVEWEVSLFGKLRSTRKSATAKYLSTQWGYRAAQLALSAEVATTLFTLAEYERCLEIATRSYELRLKATALIDSMHRYGMSNAVALEQARSLVYSAQSEVSSYQRAVAQTRLALALLMGQPLTSSITLSATINTPPPPLPIGLPSALLERRPDIMESYYTMQSAAANVGVARADRFPSISLTAEGGFITETLKELSSAKPIGWSLLGELTQPVFNFGALKQREKMAVQEYMAAMHNYEQATLSALSDVESALTAITTYNAQYISTQALLNANAKIALTTSALYKSGLGDYLSVIDAERELYASQIEFIGIATQQYINYVDLIKNLGGGF